MEQTPTTRETVSPLAPYMEDHPPHTPRFRVSIHDNGTCTVDIGATGGVMSSIHTNREGLENLRGILNTVLL